MVIEEITTYLNGLFPDCLDYFSTQKAEYLLNNRVMFVADPTHYKITVDYKHPLFTKHPENKFALLSLTTTFLKYCVPQLGRLPAPLALNDVLRAKLLADATVAVQQELHRRLSILTFGLDINFITALSGELYESSAATDFQLAILSNETDLRGVCFEPLTRWELKSQNLHAIRKQLNMAKNGALAVVQPSIGAGSYPCTLGFMNSDECDRFPRFRFLGHMEWEFHVPDVSGREKTCRMCYTQGHLALPKNILENEVFDVIHKTFSSINQSKRIQDIIVQLLKQNKGAVAVFSSPETIQLEVDRLVRTLQRGIAPTAPIPVATLPRNLPKTELMKRTENLKRITEIDGAVLIDTYGDCHAFGVILDGECIDIPESRGDMSRGARLNCSRSYIAWLRLKYSAPWLGVVISEDGMFDLL